MPIQTMMAKSTEYLRHNCLKTDNYSGGGEWVPRNYSLDSFKAIALVPDLTLLILTLGKDIELILPLLFQGRGRL